MLKCLRTTMVGTPFISNQVCKSWAINVCHPALLYVGQAAYKPMHIIHFVFILLTLEETYNILAHINYYTFMSRITLIVTNPPVYC